MAFVPIFEPDLGADERRLVIEAMDSGWISSQGQFIVELELALAKRAGLPFAVVTSNCTTALHLAFDALGIGPGDEVLCPDLTFIAPANMIELAGATPVLVDVDPVSWGIDPARMAEKITPKTKAVVVVHAFGHTADMDPIMALAQRHGLKVIEDVAEAPDALYKGRVAGSFGDAACYSFFANKIMTTGEGGAVISSDAALDKALRIRRDHGMSREKRYHHVVRGYNYRMTNLQAAIGLAQVGRLDDIHMRRQGQADQYAARFAGNVRANWRPVAEWCRPVHWLATISLREASLRDPLLDYLRIQDVDCRQMVNPVHEAEHFLGRYNPADFPVSRSISARSLHLPSSTALPGTEVDRISNLVLAWLERNDP